MDSVHFEVISEFPVARCRRQTSGRWERTMDLNFVVGVAIGVILVVSFDAITTSLLADLVELVKMPARLYQRLVRQRGYGRVIVPKRQ
jgi:hypothetical protein